MKLTVERSTLSAALSRVASIVDNKSTIPILSNIHLAATSDSLIIRATNGDMEAVEAVSASVAIPGDTTVSAAKLVTLVNSLPDGAQILINLGDRLAVSSGRTKINLSTLDPKMFPQLWGDEWPTEFEISANKLAFLIDGVSFAQSEDASRAYIQGVRIEERDGRLRMIATDGTALSYRDGDPVSEFAAVTIPTRMVTEMNRLIAQAAGSVTVGLSLTKIRLSVGGVIITSKLLDQSLGYPEYQRVIPADNPLSARVNCAAFSAAIRRAMIASLNAKDNTVYVTFKAGSVSVTSKNAEADAFDEIDADYDGEDVFMGLHPQTLLDILAHLGSDTANVTFKDKYAATTWAGAGDGMVVFMPQRVGA